MFVTSVATGANEQYIGMSIEAIAGARGEDPAVTVMDLLLEEQLEVEHVTIDGRQWRRTGGLTIESGLTGG